MTSIYGNIDMTPLSDEQLERASRKQLLTLIRGEQQLRGILEDFIEETEAREHEMKEKLTLIEGLYYRIRCTLFRPRSERSAKASRSGTSKSSTKEDQGPRLPSERYPDAEIIDKHITAAELPVCRSCGSQMEDSGLTETSEYLTVVPKQYIVVRQHRHTYRCGCHGDLVTTPALPRIIPGSNYSDEMAVDVSLSKYCDLIPMERYSQMAKRQGFAGIPPAKLDRPVAKVGSLLSRSLR